MVRTKSKKSGKREVLSVSVPATEAERTERINRAITAVRRNFGEEAIRVLTSEQKSDVQVISLGAMSLDSALGVGGLPRGRITEIFGPEASGKTTVALHAVASAQAEGGVAVFIDAEHSFDMSFTFIVITTSPERNFLRIVLDNTFPCRLISSRYTSLDYFKLICAEMAVLAGDG